MTATMRNVWVTCEDRTIQVQDDGQGHLNLPDMAAVFRLDLESIRLDNQKYQCDIAGDTLLAVLGGGSAEAAIVVKGRPARRFGSQAKGGAASTQGVRAGARTAQASRSAVRKYEQCEPARGGKENAELHAPLLANH